ncbi:MAG: hypothetical protein ABL308_12075 [Oceanicaulis sp.]
MITRRAALGLAGGFAACGLAPAGLRRSTGKRALWRNEGGPHLRGAVFVQRRVYPEVDGPSFLGPGPVGQPVTPDALSRLADAGANLASWSGPGIFAESPPFSIDAAIEDHVGAWLDACRSRGLFTTLCLRTGPGRSAFAFHPDEGWYPQRLFDNSIWRGDDKQAAWAEMVAETLRRFGDHPACAGVVAMDEPNGADAGHDGVWPGFAARIASACEGLDKGAPLIFSPDRWARTERAGELRRAVGPGPVMAVHDYDPWDFTHQAEGAQRTYRREADAIVLPQSANGDWAMLEFGAVNAAPGLPDYLEDRISAFEAAGANWAVFRWTSGWTEYEAVEGGMAVSEHPRALAVLRRAWARNTVRPA